MQWDNNGNLLGPKYAAAVFQEEILLVHYENTIKRGGTWRGEKQAGQNLFHHDFYDYYMDFCPKERKKENAKWEIYERSSKF